MSGSAGDVDYSVTVNQVYMSAVTGTLTQENINDGGFIYELPLATFNSTATSATIKQNNPILNDTGWLDLDTKSVGSNVWSDNGASAYAQYRVRDNVVFLRWRVVDVTNSTNGNQIGRVPWSLRPDTEIVAASIDRGSSTFYPVITFVNDTTTVWVSYIDNHRGNLMGSMSYPLTR